MAIPGLSEIERWITEHGSAAILKERIALVKEQYAALEKKVAALQEDNVKLQAENQHLELDNYKLKEKIGNLEKQLAKPGEQELPPESIAIIKLLASVRHAELLMAEDIARSLSIHPTRAEHFLNTLTKSRYVLVSYSSIEPPSYGLDDKGQEYAVTHGFV